ncbi:MAG TPA: sigma-70 family RNA polymerase sigma factor [Tepidisphaeraceae bacterium]|jgi:RNA polymerase sigma factor (sigma-70 family)
MQDHELLADFVRNASQEAFRQLVRRYIDTIYTAARRQVRDPQLAQDVTQTVFIVLAKKARRLHGEGSLAGWLMKTTWLLSRDAIRREGRRRRYEARAAAQADIAAETSAVAEELSPQLDRALARLSDLDRGTITLRYLQGMTLAEVGQCVGMSPDAAAKRIARALEKLRAILQPAPSVIPLAALLEQLPKHTAPTALLGTAASATAAVPVSKIVAQIVFWTKAKISITAAAVIVTLAGTAAIALIEQPPAAPTSAPAPLAAVLPDGVGVELIGLSENPSTGKAWWRGDGSPLAKPPYQLNRVANGVVKPDPGQLAREIAVRINYQVQGSNEPANVRWYVREASGSIGANPFNDRNQPITDVEAMSIAVAVKPEGVTLRFEVAAGEWSTRPEMSAPAQFGAIRTIDGRTLIFNPGYESSGQSHFVVSQMDAKSDMAYRLVAIDKQKQRHLCSQRHSMSNGTATTTEFVVPIRLDAASMVIYEQRPYDQWIEIRNISLHPGKPTPAVVITSDTRGL